MPTTAYVCLGSNTPDAPARMDAALRGLPGCWNIYHVASLGAVALMKQAGR